VPAPEISVIMSARNERRYVTEAVRSLISQTLPSLEVLFVDDASSDGTPDLVEALADPRIRVIRRNRSHGLTENLNMALALSRGRLVARMDADDLSDPARLEKLVALLGADPRLGFVSSRAHFIDENGQRLGIMGREVSGDKLAPGLLESNLLVHGAAVVRREALEASGGYRSQFRYAQDYDLWLRLAEKWCGAVAAEVLYSYRLRRGAISAAKRKQQFLYARLARRLARERRKFGIEKTDLGKAAALIERGVVPRQFRAEFLAWQLLWARSLYAGGAYRMALRQLAAVLRENPASPEAWGFVWRRYACNLFDWLAAKKRAGRAAHA